MDIYEKLARCETADEVLRMMKGNGVELARTDKSTLDMWRAGADFFSSKHGLAERCRMARYCYEAMIRARTK